MDYNFLLVLCIIQRGKKIACVFQDKNYSKSGCSPPAHINRPPYTPTKWDPADSRNKLTAFNPLLTQMEGEFEENGKT